MKALRPDERFARRYPLCLCRPMGLGKSHPKWSTQYRLPSKKRLKNLQGDSFNRTSSRSAMILSRSSKTNYLRSHRRVGGTLSRFNSKERENAIAKEFGAVFLIGIGGELADVKPHDGRAPDYDDWTTESENGYKGLNGDILVWEWRSRFSLWAVFNGIVSMKIRFAVKLRSQGTRIVSN